MQSEQERKLKLLAKIAERYKMLDGQFCHCGLPANHKVGDTYLCYRHKAPPSKNGNRGRFSGKSKTPFGRYEDR